MDHAKPQGLNEHDARIRRIQELCARLDATMRESSDIRGTAAQLRSEATKLLADLENPRRQKRRPNRRVSPG